MNDPEQDARVAFKVLQNHIMALSDLAAQATDRLLAYHYIASRMERSGRFDAIFRAIREAPPPDRASALSGVGRLLSERACSGRIMQALDPLADPSMGWPLAYAVAWISVSGGDSVMTTWVRAAGSAAPRPA